LAHCVKNNTKLGVVDPYVLNDMQKNLIERFCCMKYFYQQDPLDVRKNILLLDPLSLKILIPGVVTLDEYKLHDL